MDATALRQKVMANNLSNVNTPGYERQDVKFLDSLSEAINGDRSKMKDLSFNVNVDETAPKDGRGNSVSLQHEIAEISQNEFLYNFAAEMASQKFSTLRKAITGTK